jgi:Tfp pilus assembly protein PilF
VELDRRWWYFRLGDAARRKRPAPGIAGRERRMRHALTLLMTLLLAACAATPVAQHSEFRFRDELFAPASERISADDVFALDADMKHYLANDIGPELRAEGPQRGLFNALYKKGQLRLDYDASMTRNASQAFAAKSGNCLSLVILTAALAKELRLEVRFQTVYTGESWSRSDGIDFLDEHVNVTLGAERSIGTNGYIDANEMTIDFLPPNDLGRLRTRVIGEQTVIAMYMNNRAAEELAQRRLDNAYWWARAAIETDPTYIPGYNTLGVIYKFHQNLPEAQATFDHILEIEPENAVAMSNQVLVLSDLGRTADADALAARLKRIQPYPPFHFFDLGMLAMQRGDYASARDLFTRDIQRSAYFHESHFWLAIAEIRLGDLRSARKQLTLAEQLSTTSADHALYAAKLARLNSGRGF